MISINYDKCTGCGACYQKCPQKCIAWEDKEFGFRYPVINENLCINCNLCDKVCPINNEEKNSINQEAYAFVISDTNILMNSTSGGAFTALSKYVLQENGVVYGCSFENDMQAIHIRIEKETELKKLRGSKYVQSDTKDTFKLVERDLHDERLVLFTGTPCQIAGLNSFLNDDYNNLITADIVCHGVGSQKYFDKFVAFLTERYGKINTIQFRSKRFGGWSICGSIDSYDKKGKRTIKPLYNYEYYYYHYFLNGDIYRMSCYQCSYASLKRPGDFTLADFWGVESLGLPIKVENGCSLVLLNSDKAKKIFKELKNSEKVKVSIDNAIRKNEQLRKPHDYSPIRNTLATEYIEFDGNKIQENYLKKNIKVRVRGILKRIIPYKIKMVLRKRG